ncbi:MAG: amidohydrolase [Deltaproteobacteria bacterium]|nr:amidohydrolase [Deltaproteobacteria bacterium]
MAMDLVIDNALLVLGGPDMETCGSGAVGIAGDEIAWVGKTPEKPRPEAARTLDAAGGILLPGLVNAHCHLPMTLFRGLADDLALDDWLTNHIFPAEARFITPHNAAAGTRLAAAELLLSGVTSVCDGYFCEEAVAEAACGLGMRVVAGHGVLDFPAPGVPDPAKSVRTAADFAEKLLDRHPLCKPSIFCHSPYTCSPATLAAAKRACRKLGILFQTHAAETKGEVERFVARHGKTPIRHLHDLGVLDENTLVVHAVWAGKEDIGLLAETGAGVAVCTNSNLKLASGIAPLPALLSAGVSVGLGTDGAASNNRLDLFSETAATARLHKAASGDPTVVDAKTALYLATEGGARASGLGRTGRIEVGWAADLVLLDPDSPSLTPCYDPVSHAVYAASAADVLHVFVAGRQVVENRRLTTADLSQILAEAREVARQIRAAR